MSDKVRKSVRFIMVGGFLGAGKTTTLLRMAAYFMQKNLKVGIITNDQAKGLIDTQLVKQLGLSVKEITGGCFCCKSDTLVDSLAELEHEGELDIIIAEPVGSCTDLEATVRRPLVDVYRKDYVMAPYVVLADPFRLDQMVPKLPDPFSSSSQVADDLEESAPGASAIMEEMDGVIARIGGASIARRSGRGFSENIGYIFNKQLEEADVIVINKLDVLSGSKLADLRARLENSFPNARILEMSSRDGIAMRPLFDLLGKEVVDKAGKVGVAVDYGRYGEGEALLGWVNGDATIAVEGSGVFDGNNWLMDVATRIYGKLCGAGIEIAHLKLALIHSGKESVTIQTSASHSEPEFTCRLRANIRSGRLLFNLRAEGNPEKLECSIRGALDTSVAERSAVKVSELEFQAFRPAQPIPVHRIH